MTDVLLGCVFRKRIFPEGRSKITPNIGCVGGGGMGFRVVGFRAWVKNKNPIIYFLSSANG